LRPIDRQLPPAVRRYTTLRLVFCRRFRGWPATDGRRKLCGFRATVKDFVLFFGWMICRAAAPPALAAAHRDRQGQSRPAEATLKLKIVKTAFSA